MTKALDWRPIAALLLSAAIALMGNGLAGVLLPLRADIEAFDKLSIGLMGSSYFAGLLAGCLIAPGLIGRVGHIRAFVAFTAVATIAPLCHALAVEPWIWWLLRVLTGICFAGLFMIIESWLNVSATAETRGRVMALYTIVSLTVLTLGMQMVGLAEVGGFALFSLVAMLYSLAAIPVSLTRATAPVPPRQPKLRLLWLLGVSPASVIGSFMTGVANSAFWTLSPLYARGAGLDVQEVAMFLSAGVLAGAVMQWPIGVLSDRIGRRPMLTAVAIVGALASLGLYAESLGSKTVIYVLVSLFGVGAFAIYTLCVAHANDLVHSKRAVEVSGGLLLVFSAGAVLGPFLASGAMSALGHGGIFLHTMIAHILVICAVLLRARQRPVLPRVRNADFVAIPRTTPAVFELDPRAMEATETEDEEAARQQSPAAPAAK